MSDSTSQTATRRADAPYAFPQDSAIILVHGAWADGSCWSNVILPLQRHGLNVICAPLPLTSLTDDIAALRRALERTSGPVVLAGHAYAGAVIGAADDTRVKSLVFVAALAPDEGETVSQVLSWRTAPGRPEVDTGPAWPAMDARRGVSPSGCS
jgi:pimeloyl-ACP methyl ester carboxylesterase